MTKEPKEEKIFECKHGCGFTSTRKTGMLSHERKCPNNPSSPKFKEEQKKSSEELENKIKTTKEAEKEINELKKTDNLSDNEKMQLDALDKKVKTIKPPLIADKELLNETQKLQAQKTHDTAELQALTAEKKLSDALSSPDPTDKILNNMLKQQQLKMFQNVGGNDQNQDRLFQIQSDNFKAQLENQKQMAAMSKDISDKQFEFMKLELERSRKEGSDLGQLEKFKKLAETLGYEKGEGNDMMKLVSDNIQNIPKIIDSARGLKQDQQKARPVQTFSQIPPPAAIIPNEVISPNPGEEEVYPNVPPPQQDGVESSQSQPPTDEQLLKNKSLHDDSRPTPSEDTGYGSYQTEQSLGLSAGYEKAREKYGK